MEVTFKEKLLDSLLYEDLNHLIKTISIELNSPINITNEAFHVLVQYPKERLNDIIWDSYLINDSLSVELINLLDQQKLIEKGYLSNKPYVIFSEKLGKYPRVTSKISFQDHILGYLTLYSMEETVSEEMLSKIEIATKVIAFHMNQINNSNSLVRNRIELFMSNLLSNAIHNNRELEEWLTDSSIDIRSNYLLICASSGSKHKQSMLISVLEEINKGFSLCTIYQNEIYILIQSAETESSQKKINDLIKVLKSYHFKIGVSDEYTDLLQTSKYQKQSYLAMLKAKNDEIIYFMDIGLSLLAEEIVDGNGDFYIHSGFEKLKQFDKKNKTEYYQTLICFLENFGSHLMVEKHLKIHRNTVYNRIRTIEDLLTLDLSNAYTFSYLYISYLMLVNNEQQ